MLKFVSAIYKQVVSNMNELYPVGTFVQVMKKIFKCQIKQITPLLFSTVFDTNCLAFLDKLLYLNFTKK